MVATWNPAANAEYYTKQIAYYVGESGVESQGRWFSPGHDFGLNDNSPVNTELFERLFAGLDEKGQSLLSNSGGRIDRVPAFDITFSAPRSVSLVWALADKPTRIAMEEAHAGAVRQTLQILEKEAAYARRGRGGSRIERVNLSAACFQHGESRPAEHSDGFTFADPNLHTHCVVLNLAARADGSVGALHSTILRDWKMAAGAIYHASLAAGLKSVGFEIDRTSKNGIFEIAGVADDVISYFSARRQEITEELARAGTDSANAGALAAAIARKTRSAKQADTASREKAWAEAAQRIGFDATAVLRKEQSLAELHYQEQQKLLAARLAKLPASLTETRSVLERRELFRAVADAFVGLGIGSEHVAKEVDRLLGDGLFVEIGRDRLGLPRYSTPEMIRIERELVVMSRQMAIAQEFPINQKSLEKLCLSRGLSSEQIAAVQSATAPGRLSIVEGAPGTGKTTLLRPIVDAWKAEGYRVVGTATAWRMANVLRDDLAIESRATASWLKRDEQGQRFLDAKSALIVDEAGLLSSREMHALLKAAQDAGAKVLLIGDRQQLQAIGAGSGLRLAAHAMETAKVETIFRQREAWAKEAITAFGKGDAEAALQSFVDRNLFKENDNVAAAIKAVVDHVESSLVGADRRSALIIAKTNKDVAAISGEVRDRLRQHGLLEGADVTVDAVTPSGHANKLALATGDHIRFLMRNDKLGIINGTEATITKVVPALAEAGDKSIHANVEARIGQRIIQFNTAEIADEHGRARLGWSYASTVYGSQGMTVDRAAILLTPSFDRHDIYVASSRARGETLLVTDKRRVEQEMQTGNPSAIGNNRDQRLHWLAQRLSANHIKETTFDFAPDGIPSAIHHHNAGLHIPIVAEADHLQPEREKTHEIGNEL
ncbi:relaxase domain-containing protein [Ochrobactrum sp. CM-21-5]|nr:MobF family relaxase [Ochrobactrum sp. CM-21-5]MBC2884657.1 relaxase domain-containing protein [Ochrobactrum sp. CM-21-5]